MASRPAIALAQSLKQSLHRPQILSQSYICINCRGITSQVLRAPGQTQRSTIRPAPSNKSPTSESIPAQHRTFSNSSRTLKKSSTNPKSSRKSPPIDTPSKPTNPIPDNKHTRTLDNEPDPYDHSALSTAIDTAISRLKESLTKTRDAGRVSTSMLEDLPVDLNQHAKGTTTSANSNSPPGGAGAHKTRTTIRDIASVVPKGGRTMQIFLAAEAHAKPVTSAVQASPYSLTPTVDPQNPLLLIVPVPPATAETRRQAEAEAKKCFDRASLEVRNARGDAQKRHKKMEQEKAVVPDELRKAHKGMEEVAKKGQDEVKKVFDNAVKALHNV